jgi:transcriptional regulator with XRE-family HTH domain
MYFYIGTIIMSKASRSLRALPPAASNQIKKLGQDIAVARKRRRISMKSMAERMMVSLETVQRLEKGDASVGIGIMVSALWVLGVYRRIGELVAPESDIRGMQEEIRRLPRDFRRSRKKTEKKEAQDTYDF